MVVGWSRSSPVKVRQFWAPSEQGFLFVFLDI
jgi:hypothetical protein